MPASGLILLLIRLNLDGFHYMYTSHQKIQRLAYIAFLISARLSPQKIWYAYWRHSRYWPDCDFLDIWQIPVMPQRCASLCFLTGCPDCFWFPIPLQAKEIADWLSALATGSSIIQVFFVETTQIIGSISRQCHSARQFAHRRSVI